MDVKINGDKLVITIDVSADALKAAPPSASGKTRVVASSHGFANFSTPAGMVSVSLNATTK
jgi:hypothetical protein